MRAAQSKCADAEVDVVGIGDDPGDLLVGECQWTERRVGTNVLEDLRRSASVLLRSYPARRVHCVLFARSGFTPDLHRVAQSEPVFFFTLEGLTSRQARGHAGRGWLSAGPEAPVDER